MRFHVFSRASCLLSMGIILASGYNAFAVSGQGRVIIKFNEKKIRKHVHRTATDGTQRALQQLPLPKTCILRENKATRAFRAKKRNKKAILPEPTDFSRFMTLSLPATFSVSECLRRLKNHPLVDYAEEDSTFEAGSVFPNDSGFDQQWYHYNLIDPNSWIHTPEAWDITTGSSNVVIAILDTGLDAGILDFTNRVVAGYNFVSDNTNITDDNNHGTRVTSIAAARGQNLAQLAGVDWNCQIMPIKVLDAGATGLYSDWAAGIDWAVGNGAHVINLSAGGTNQSLTVATSISNAVAQGVTVVTITHNDGGAIRFPGTLSNVITVGATDLDSNRAVFSSWGPSVDIVAPGTNMVCLGPTGVTNLAWGTSFAAPLVTGTISLMLSIRPELSPAEVAQILYASAEDQVGEPGEDTPGHDIYYGWGKLNVFNALTLTRTRAQTPSLNGSGDLLLSWESSPNASNKLPYVIEYKQSLTNDWITIQSPTNFTYMSDSVSWVDNGTETPSHPTNAPARFYRIGITGF